MWKTIKNVFAWIGAAAIAVAGVLLVRRGSRADLPDHRERAGAVRDDIQESKRANSTARDAVDKSLDIVREAKRDNRKFGEILRAVRKRGTGGNET